MIDPLTEALTAPTRPTDPCAWRASLDDAAAVLARLAVRRAGAGRFRVTDHDVRVALSGEHDTIDPEPFSWTARTARRSIGLAAIRLLVAGAARSPSEAVGSRLDESTRWVRDGNPCATQLDRWVAGLPAAGRAAVSAEAVTWATRLWCAVDWGSLTSAPVVGRDRWWDSPHSALLAVRGRADVRTDRASLVVLSGPRRDSVRAELALVLLVDAMRGRGPAAPGRVIGWWPDSGHLVRVEPEPVVLTLAAGAIADAFVDSAPRLGTEQPPTQDRLAMRGADVRAA